MKTYTIQVHNGYTVILALCKDEDFVYTWNLLTFEGVNDAIKSLSYLLLKGNELVYQGNKLTCIDSITYQVNKINNLINEYSLS
jgi:hypothetical protein